MIGCIVSKPSAGGAGLLGQVVDIQEKEMDPGQNLVALRPDSTGTNSDLAPSMTIACCFAQKTLIHVLFFPLIPHWLKGFGEVLDQDVRL